MNQIIEVYKKQVYSETYTYAADAATAKILQKLTTHKTITDTDRECLEALGFEFKLILDPNVSL